MATPWAAQTEAEKAITVAHALETHHGNVAEAARALAITRAALSVWIHRHSAQLGYGQPCEKCGQPVRKVRKAG